MGRRRRDEQTVDPAGVSMAVILTQTRKVEGCRCDRPVAFFDRDLSDWRCNKCGRATKRKGGRRGRR